MVPLAADLERQQRAVRLKPAATSQTDRRSTCAARASGPARCCCTGSRLLGVDWGTEADAGGTTGTFKEAWELEWHPELAVAVIEASLFGTTVAAAAAAKVAEQPRAAPTTSPRLGRLVSQCLLADLPEGLRSVVAALEERTARQHDVLALLGAVEPLARTTGTATSAASTSAASRRCCGPWSSGPRSACRAACVGLDDDAPPRRSATASRALTAAWRCWTTRGCAAAGMSSLEAVAARDRVHGSVAGRVDRLLLDAGRIDQADAATPDEPAAVRRRAAPTTARPGSTGSCRGSRCCWSTTRRCSAIVDEWVSGIAETTFEDLLPLLRRTFSRFQPPERSSIGRQVARLGGGGAVDRSRRPSGSTSSAPGRRWPRVAAPARAGGGAMTDDGSERGTRTG